MDKATQTVLVKHENRHEIPRWTFIRPLANGWIRAGKRNVHHRPASDLSKQNRTTWYDIPQELRDMIWEYALPAGRIHELSSHWKQRYPWNRDHRYMVLASNNRRTPNIFHVCRESRKRALELFQLCEYNPRILPANSQIGKATCVEIKPFYFNKAEDTLYLVGVLGGWLGFVWARTDTSWDEYLFDGWKHVALDLRQTFHWLGQTRGTMKAWPIIKHPPLIRFRDMFPSLRRLSFVVDNNHAICPKPIEDNSSLEDSVEMIYVEGSWQQLPNGWTKRSTSFAWKKYLGTEYSEAELPVIDIQRIVRKKSNGAWCDRWVRLRAYHSALYLYH